MLATRSRKGCIDCKQAKVKCDEVHPSCGTCVRRGRQCRGYNLPNTIAKDPVHEQRESSFYFQGQAASWAGVDTQTPVATESISTWTPIEEESGEIEEQSTQLHLPSGLWIVSTTPSTAGYSRKETTEPLNEWLPLLKYPSFIPLGEIQAADKPFIEVYFIRHPSDLVMSDTFVNEMNAVSISLLQRSPAALGDALSAIGEIYLKDTVSSSAIQVSCRKTRLLSRLRAVNEDGSSLELVLALLLGLCGVELVDPQSDGRGDILSVLVENMSLMLEFHMRVGKELNETEKYLTRAIARQDLLISLSRMQRTKISPSIWLDNYTRSHADRFMGCTTTLAPILSELCALAEDVQFIIDTQSITDTMEMAVEPPTLINQQYAGLVERKRRIQVNLEAWRPLHDYSMSMKTSTKFLLHAYAWRAAALLYLFRLFDRPGSSLDADQIALGMAYEVMVHISGPAEEIKLSLWPLFIAACEVDDQQDRDNAIQLFDSICYARPTVTAKRTKWFCVNQIWPTRDQGGDWDWMKLRRLDSNNFIPI